MKNLAVVFVYTILCMVLYFYTPILTIGLIAWTIAINYFELKDKPK